jgi:hypothetical protein
MGRVRPATTTQGDGEQMFRERLSSRQTAVKAMHNDVTDPAEYFILTLVDDLREWRQRSPTVDFRSTGASFDMFRRIGKANEILNRIAQLGFFFTLRPDGKGDTKLDIWKPAGDRIDPAFELGRMLGPQQQPAPVPEPAGDRIDPAFELGRMIGTQQPAPAPASATDPVADFTRALVADFREWRATNSAPQSVFRYTFQSSEASLFHACVVAGKTKALMTRLGQLGFQSTLRPSGKRQAALDVWKRASEPIPPSSDLARVLALPTPESQLDKVADKLDYINREFTRWLLANNGDTPVGQFLSTAVYFGGLSDADGTLLRRALLAHGWHADPAAIGVSPAFTFFRRTPPPQQQ